MKVLREIEFEGQVLYACPNGCDESELETGTEGQTFMAIMGKPHKYLRCGKCLFGEENKENAKVDMADALSVWNAACESAVYEENHDG